MLNSHHAGFKKGKGRGTAKGRTNGGGRGTGDAGRGGTEEKHQGQHGDKSTSDDDNNDLVRVGGRLGFCGVVITKAFTSDTRSDVALTGQWRGLTTSAPLRGWVVEFARNSSKEEHAFLSFPHVEGYSQGQTHTVSPPRRATIRAAFDDMRIAAASMEQAPSLHEPIDDVFFGRLLVATDFDVTKSMKLARAYVAFRREMGGSIPPPLEIMRTRSFMLPFCDVSGRPVLFVRGKYVDTRLKVETLRKMFRAFQDVSRSCLKLGLSVAASRNSPFLPNKFGNHRYSTFSTLSVDLPELLPTSGWGDLSGQGRRQGPCTLADLCGGLTGRVIIP